MNQDKSTVSPAGKRWWNLARRFGVLGFLFFLIKGLIWIAVFALGWKGCSTLRETERSGVGAYHPEVSPHEFLTFQPFDNPILLPFVFQVDEGKSL